jgi:hypothetical protein
MKKITQLLKIVPLALCVYASSAQALVINFIPTPGMSQQSLAGFQAAANRWQSVLHDDVTVNLNINFSTLGTGILGSTGSTRGSLSYAGYREALTDDAWGNTDAAAVASLSQAACLKVFMNGTNANPSGVGSGNTFLDSDCDANNQTIRMTWANARALGLTAAHDNTVDGSVAFSDAFTWDFDPSDGIAANAFDFIGVATHEIGHALGFVSGVDTLDANRSGNFTDAAFTYIAPADLFRCTADSRAAGGDLDWAADKRNKFFSLDNCATTIAQFSTGRTFGDGQQASHWKDNLHLGILDPTAGRGELLAITDLDLQLYDAIGWNVVPEPASVALFMLGLFGLAGVRRRVK